MKSAYVSYPIRDVEMGFIVERLRRHLGVMGVQMVEAQSTSCDDEGSYRPIIEAISRCSVFISFLRDDNPNMMFELGYAYAKNRRIIIVGNDLGAIPVDLQNSVFIRGDSPTSEVISQIEARLHDTTEFDQLALIRNSNPAEIVETLVSQPNVLDSIDAMEFERIVADWFTAQGYRVRAESQLGGRDLGYDFIVDGFEKQQAVVQVKKYKSSSQVSISVVRQMVGAMALEGIQLGIIVSSAPFTRSAFSFVSEIEPRILLWTLEDLCRIAR